MKSNTLNEHVAKMLHRAKYLISETPKYKAVLGNDSQFDGLPDYLNKMTEADVQSGSTTPAASPDMSAPAAGSEIPSTDPNADPLATTPADAPMPSAGGASTPGSEPMPSAPTSPEAGISEPPMGEPAPAPMEMGPSKDELEKQVLQLQLAAMHKMSDKIQDLEAFIETLNCKLDSFAADVEEVKEPTHIQKFMDRKEDSHPYYYNLNDLWSNNTFNARVDNFSKGYQESPEGGYVADFDNFQTLSPQELKQSFNEF